MKLTNLQLIKKKETIQITQFKNKTEDITPILQK